MVSILTVMAMDITRITITVAIMAHSMEVVRIIMPLLENMSVPRTTGHIMLAAAVERQEGVAMRAQQELRVLVGLQVLAVLVERQHPLNRKAEQESEAAQVVAAV